MLKIKKNKKEIGKQLKNDIIDIMNVFYKTPAHYDYEAQTKVYMEKKQLFIMLELKKLNYEITEHHIIKNGVSIDLEDFRKCK